MFIDFHAHVYSQEIIAEGFWDGWVKLGSSLSGRPPEKIRRRLPELWDPSGARLIEDMDEAGIDHSVIHVLDYGMAPKMGEAAKGIREINQLYAGICEKYPERVTAFASVDPRRKNAVDDLKSFVREFNMKGIKLLPSTGFYPNDRICYPIYEFASNNTLPVFFHTGPSPLPVYSKYGQPVLLDDVAVDFPELKIVMGHAGGCWWHEALAIAANKPNVYLELAGWQPRVRRLPTEEFYTPLRLMLTNIGSTRILFGSDWPAFNLLMKTKEWLSAFQQPPSAVAEAGISLKEEDVNNILGANAARLLKMS